MRKKKIRQHADYGQQQAYDNVLKSMLEGHEQEVLPQFLEGIEYLETLDIETLRTPLRVDRVYLVMYRGEKHILHIEFEASPDKDMGARLLNYHAYFHHKYGHPVISIIIYPFPTKILTSPYRETSGEEEIVCFRFHPIALWELEAQDYVDRHLIEFYTLLPLMKGANVNLVSSAIEEMVEYYHGDEGKQGERLKWLSVLVQRSNVLMLNEKERIMEKINSWDQLLENDPYLKKREARAEARGAAKARAEAQAEAEEKIARLLAKAQAQTDEARSWAAIAVELKAKAQAQADEARTALRGVALRIIQERFPELLETAREKMSNIDEQGRLGLLIEQLLQAKDEEMARWLLGTLMA